MVRPREKHRIDGPAIIAADGTTFWYSYGRLHRENGPAIERADGSKEWWYDGRRLRTGERPVKESEDLEWPTATWLQWAIDVEDHSRYISIEFLPEQGCIIQHLKHDGADYPIWYKSSSWKSGQPGIDALVKHRLDGPAVNHSGEISWWIDGRSVEPFTVLTKDQQAQLDKRFQ